MAIVVLTAGTIEIMDLPVHVIWTRLVTTDEPTGGPPRVAWEAGGRRAQLAAKAASDIAAKLGISMQAANAMLGQAMRADA